MKTLKHRAFTIKLTEEDGEIKVAVTRDDGSLIEHDNNPDYYEEEEDAIEHGKTVIDEYLEQ